MAPNNTDRRRFLLATGLTLLALPALWWANQATDTGAPKVATAGVNVGNTTAEPVPVAAQPAPDPAPAIATQSDIAIAAVAAPTPATPRLPVDTATDTDPDAPVFFGGPSAPSALEAPKIAAPAPPDVVAILTEATYQGSIAPADSCLAFGVETGVTLTIVNLDNGHSITCTAVRTFDDRREGLVLHTDTFAKIADLTDAPVPVEIRQ